MRIAWCLYGQPRKYKKGFEYTKRNLFDHHDVDVFFHTWHDIDKVGQEYDTLTCHDPGSHEADIKENLLSLYKPKKYSFEKSIKFHDESDGLGTNVFFSYTYSRFQANENKKKYEQENNFRYDWVICARFDWAQNSQILFQELDYSFMYLPDYNGTISNPNNLHCNDQFAFSSSENMDIYTNLFNNIKDYWSSMEIKHMRENLLFHHLVTNGVKMKHFDYIHTFPSNGVDQFQPHSLIR